MNILIGLSVFQTGGAEMFALRLGTELKNRGHQVYFYDVYKNDRNVKFCNLINENNLNIIEIELNKNLNDVLWKLNGLFSKFGIKSFYKLCSDKLKLIKLNKLCKELNISVVNSHTFQSDLFLSKLKLPLVITMHGDYEEGYKGIKSDEKVNIFLNDCKNILTKTKHLIYVAEKNLEVVNLLNLNPISTKVYVGLNKINDLFYPKSDDNIFKFLMLARGIENKGWLIAINAFKKLHATNSNVRLDLVYTETEYMNSLKDKYVNTENIYFNGYSANPIEYILNCDCVVLPSFSECCPTCLIEAMAYHKPSIASDVGDVKHMLEIDTENQCGYCVEFDNKNIEEIENKFSEKMKCIIINTKDYNLFKINTYVAFQKFNFSNVTSKYLEIFEKINIG